MNSISTQFAGTRPLSKDPATQLLLNNWWEQFAQLYEQLGKSKLTAGQARIGGINDYFVVSAGGDVSFNGDAKVASDMSFENGKFLVFDPAAGNGIKLGPAAPTYGFADLKGDQFTRNQGSTKPSLVSHNGAVKAWQFGAGDEAYLTYHIEHDHKLGTDIHLHIHWSQNNAGCTGGTVDFKYTAEYAKGWNQLTGSAFTSTPVTDTFSSIDINDGGSGLVQRQKHITEVTISAAAATAALFDRDVFEPDGVIELTFEMVGSNLTGTPSLPFIHYVDISFITFKLKS